MEELSRYEAFLRKRITELREQKGISEHRMSLELGKSGSYIRAITNEKALPSLRELFNIFEYFDLTPLEFFTGLEDEGAPRTAVLEQIRTLSNEDLEKVSLFISWIRK